MSRRTEMLASTIQKELAMIMLRELSDPRLTGMPSITRVKVSADLSIADVYVTIMGTPGQQSAALNALKHSAGLMRTRLTKMLTLRVAPFIKFHIDEDLKKELAVLDLLDKVRKENEELDRQRAEAAAAAAGEPAGNTSDAAPEAANDPGSDPVPANIDPVAVNTDPVAVNTDPVAVNTDPVAVAAVESEPVKTESVSAVPVTVDSLPSTPAQTPAGEGVHAVPPAPGAGPDAPVAVDAHR